MDMSNKSSLAAVKKGDMLVLRDFHTLEATGGEYTGEISGVHVWRFASTVVYGFVIQPAPDTTLMLVVRVSGDAVDTRLFRLWESGLAKDMSQTLPVLRKAGDDTGFAPFQVDFGDGQPVVYSVKSPYPFWDAKKADGSQVAVCEYFSTLNGVPVEAPFWALHGLVEWHAYVGGPKADGMDGLLSVWFGWDVGASDFDIIGNRA